MPPRRLDGSRGHGIGSQGGDRSDRTCGGQTPVRVSGERRPPVLTLAENFAGSPGIYSVRSEADSAAPLRPRSLTKASANSCFSSPGADADTISARGEQPQHLWSAACGDAALLTAGGAEKAVTDMARWSTSPKRSSSQAARPIHRRSFRRCGRTACSARTCLIGTNRWLAYPLNDPLLEGAYIAALDLAEIGPSPPASKRPSTTMPTSTSPTPTTWSRSPPASPARSAQRA